MNCKFAKPGFRWGRARAWWAILCVGALSACASGAVTGNRYVDESRGYQTSWSASDWETIPDAWSYDDDFGTILTQTPGKFQYFTEKRHDGRPRNELGRYYDPPKTKETSIFDVGLGLRRQGADLKILAATATEGRLFKFVQAHKDRRDYGKRGELIRDYFEIIGAPSGAAKGAGGSSGADILTTRWNSEQGARVLHGRFVGDYVLLVFLQAGNSVSNDLLDEGVAVAKSLIDENLTLLSETSHRN